MEEKLKVAEADLRAMGRAERDARAAQEASEKAKKAAEETARTAVETARAAEAAATAAKDQWARAEDWARSAQQRAEEAETSRLEMEKELEKAQGELAAARAEHQRYVDVALPAAREDARAEAVAEYLQSEEFKARLVSEYQDGMRDMKACFIDSNPSLVGVDWSFVPSWSEETAAEEPLEEGEVAGPAPAPEVVVVDEPEQPEAPEQPVAPEQPPTDQPATPNFEISMADIFPDHLD